MNNDDLHSNYDGISSVIPNVKNTIDNQNANASQENSSNEYNSVGSSEPVGIVPTVLPPSVNSSGIVNQVNDEDGVIFKPFIEELNLLNEDTTGNVSDSFSEPTNLSANDQPVQQPNVVVDKLSQKKEIDKPQKVKSVQVPVEYKPPGFFKKFLMLLMFLLVLGIIIFLPQIEEYIEQYNSSGGDIDNVILDGKMSCNYDTNDKKFDYLYDIEFSFKNKELTSIIYKLNTKGDASLDSDELSKLYEECKNVSNSLQNANVSGIKVSCDKLDGVVIVDQTIDYLSFDASSVTDFYKSSSVKIPEFQAKENIYTIKEKLQAKGYTCELNDNN